MKLISPLSNGLNNSGSQTNLLKSKSKSKGITNTISSSHSLSNKKPQQKVTSNQVNNINTLKQKCMNNLLIKTNNISQSKSNHFINLGKKCDKQNQNRQNREMNKRVQFQTIKVKKFIISQEQFLKQTKFEINQHKRHRSQAIIYQPKINDSSLTCFASERFMPYYQNQKKNRLNSHEQLNSMAESVQKLMMKKTKKKQKQLVYNSTLDMTKEGLSVESFKIVRKIGKGRFGSVFLAQHIKSQAVIALKVLSKAQIKEEQMQGQIISQIKLQLSLEHPNILQLYSFFSSRTHIYLVLQYAPNGSLFQVLHKQIRFPQSLVGYYFKQMIQAMKYLHSESVIHRDLKPENIMVGFGVAKLGDFGWAVREKMLMRSTFCGTLDYVSPEIVKGELYDQRVDIWSLGVLLFQLATGHAPFQTKNSIQTQTLERILSNKIQFPLHMSQQLINLISQILKNRPDQRIGLSQIQESEWLKKYQLQGRFIDEQLFEFWKNH